MSAAPLFELDDLHVEFGSGPSAVRAVRGVSITVEPGTSVGIVGESGSGKSVSFLAAFGLLPSNGRVARGSARLDGTDLLALPEVERRRLLGSSMAMIFQNPITALNPVLSIGAQIVEALRIHNSSMSVADARRRTVELLDEVGINDAERRARQYPHEFSGGMCQRAMIAMAIANRPRLLVADEPTTAVDVTIQAQLLALLRSVSSHLSGGSILISHDLGVIAENTDRVVVMYGGQVMEQGPTREVLDSPQHPYTQGLLSCRPSLHSTRRLVPIPGQPPDPSQLGDGCPFVHRCPVGRNDPVCATVTPPLEMHVGPHGRRLAACHHAGTIAFDARPDPSLVDEGADRAVGKAAGSATDLGPILSGIDLRMQFPARRQRRRVGSGSAAVDGVDVALFPGESLGLVGESGSGKSTLARVLMRLLTPTAGKVLFSGTDITAARRRSLQPLRDRVQIVFQDPFNALNPKLSVAANAAEPLRLRGIPESQRRRRIADLFTEVGLASQLLDRLPNELSGGQLQRVGIARALSVRPDVLVLDEPVSALDVSVEAQILNLLRDLQEARNLAYLFISHDMSVVRYVCHRVAVMYLGQIVELADADVLFTDPRHPYTQSLLAAIPDTDGTRTEPEAPRLTSGRIPHRN